MGETAGTSGATGAGVGREEGGWDGGEDRDTWGWERGEPGTLNGDGVSNLCEVLQLSNFPHFEGEGGNGGRVVCCGRSYTHPLCATGLICHTQQKNLLLPSGGLQGMNYNFQRRIYSSTFYGASSSFVRSHVASATILASSFYRLLLRDERRLIDERKCD
jgi:hypothetical protein